MSATKGMHRSTCSLQLVYQEENPKTLAASACVVVVLVLLDGQACLGGGGGGWWGGEGVNKTRGVNHWVRYSMTAQNVSLVLLDPLSAVPTSSNGLAVYRWHLY